ncbi:MAG: hypothetical protein JWO43_599 [Candidatus Adlerbacteria bacterium]|nr:hypothetical protein [Candidatus Adlerbacteria bacterium]
MDANDQTEQWNRLEIAARKAGGMELRIPKMGMTLTELIENIAEVFPNITHNQVLIVPAPKGYVGVELPEGIQVLPN